MYLLDKHNRQKQKKNKTSKKSDPTADGIGNESYTMSNEIAKTLETDLTEFYNISELEASNNKIIITADASKMKDGKITTRRSGDIVEPEVLLDVIQQIVSADLGDDIDKFKLKGPIEAAPGILIISILPATQT